MQEIQILLSLRRSWFGEGRRVYFLSVCWERAGGCTSYLSACWEVEGIRVEEG